MSQNDRPWDQFGLSDDYFASEQSSGEGGSNLFATYHERIPSSSQTDYTRASGASSPSAYEKPSNVTNEASDIPYKSQSCINDTFASNFPERISSTFQAPTANFNDMNAQMVDQQGSNLITSAPLYSYAQQVSFPPISPPAPLGEDEEQTPKPLAFSGQYAGSIEGEATIPAPFPDTQIPLEPHFLRQSSETAGNVLKSRKRSRLSTDDGTGGEYVVGNNAFPHPSPSNAFDTGITPLNEAMLSLCLSKLEGRSPNERELDGLQIWTDLPFRTITSWLQARGIPFDPPITTAFKTVAVPAHADHPGRDLQNTCQAKPISTLSWDEPRNATKPYSCTNRCGMTFRKKGDWVRHEEITCPQYRWYCGRHGCPKFFRRDKYTDHLQNVHKMAKALVTSQLVDSARTPLLVEFSKKCGFCGRPCNSWKDWIDHVAEHFEEKILGGPWVMSKWNDPWVDDEEAGPSSHNSDDDSGGDGGIGPGGSYNSADDSFGGSGGPPFYHGQDPDSGSGSGSGCGQYGQFDGPYDGGGMPGSYFNITQNHTGKPHHQPAPSNDAMNEESARRSSSLLPTLRSASIIKQRRSDETQNPKDVIPTTWPLPKAHKSSKQPMKTFLHDDDPLGNFAYSGKSQREDINARLDRKLQDVRQLFNANREKDKEDPEAKYGRSLDETVRGLHDSREDIVHEKSPEDSHGRDNSNTTGRFRYQLPSTCSHRKRRPTESEPRNVWPQNLGGSGLDSESDGHVASIEDARKIRRKNSTNESVGQASTDIKKHTWEASSSMRNDQSVGPVPTHRSRESSSNPVIGSGMGNEKHKPEPGQAIQKPTLVALLGQSGCRKSSVISSLIDQYAPRGQVPTNSSSCQVPVQRKRRCTVDRRLSFRECNMSQDNREVCNDNNMRDPELRCPVFACYMPNRPPNKRQKKGKELSPDPNHKYEYIIRLIDTPSFDDTVRTDTEILKEVSDFLAATYAINNQLAGTLYVHRVSRNRTSNAELHNLRMFQELCGKSNLSNFVLGTTRWNMLEDIVPDRKAEKELMDKNDFWASMNEGENEVFRQYDGPRSAMTVVDYIRSLQGGRAVMDFQRGKLERAVVRLKQTVAGKEATREVIKQEEEHVEELASTRQTLQDAIHDENDCKRAEVRARLETPQVSGPRRSKSGAFFSITGGAALLLSGVFMLNPSLMAVGITMMASRSQKEKRDTKNSEGVARRSKMNVEEIEGQDSYQQSVSLSIH